MKYKQISIFFIKILTGDDDMYVYLKKNAKETILNPTFEKEVSNKQTHKYIFEFSLCIKNNEIKQIHIQLRLSTYFFFIEGKLKNKHTILYHSTQQNEPCLLCKGTKMTVCKDLINETDRLLEKLLKHPEIRYKWINERLVLLNQDGK